MKPKCRLTGADGNIFNLMSIASKTLKEADLPERAEEMIQRITKEANSYEDALTILMEYVEVE